MRIHETNPLRGRDPPLQEIPEGDWYCEYCAVEMGLKANPHAATTSTQDAAVSSSSLSMQQDEVEGQSLQLQGLELEAAEELRQSIGEGEYDKILKLSALQPYGQMDSKVREGKLTMEEIQLSPNTSIFSAMLFTCPVPTRLENRPMDEIITVPLRRHLRIIAAAVREAFMSMQVAHIRRSYVRHAAGLPMFNEQAQNRTARRGWLIQMSPQLMDIESCARKEGSINVLLRRHANLIKVGDRIFLWKTGKVQLKVKDGTWEPVGGGLVAIGHVRTAAEVQTLTSAMAAHLRPLGKRLDPWKETMSCNVILSHVFKEELVASKLRSQLRCDVLPIFENAVGSVYRLTTSQVLAVEEILQRHDPSLSPGYKCSCLSHFFLGMTEILCTRAADVVFLS